MTDFNEKRLAEVRSRFVNDIKEHIVTQQLNQGTFRHYLCKKPGDSNCYFEVTTIPGRLFITGDMGTCVWERTHDMLNWFRGANYDYAAAKVSQEITIREFCPDEAREWTNKAFKDGCLDEHLRDCLLEALDSCEAENDFYDVFRSDCDMDIPGRFEIYGYHYLWQFEAVKWLLRKLDAGEYRCETQ